MTEELLRDAALEYAKAGRLVFPCTPEKTPYTTHGFEDATDDVAQIEAWWDEHPGACIGMAIPEGFVVLDVDPRNGGDETLKALRLAQGRGAFPRTRTAATGGGGFHYWYAVDPTLEMRGHLGRGIDVKRAGRGYVIAPPSWSVVGRYEWTNDAEIATAPEWLVEALRRPERERAADATTAAPSIPPFMDGTRYGEAAMAAELETLRATGEGGRNDALNLAAFNLATLIAGGELREEPTRTALEIAADDLGLAPREIALTIDSAFDAGFQSPRNAPDRPESESAGNRAGNASASILELLDAQNDGPTLEDAESHFWLDWSADAEEDEFLLWPLIPRHAYVLVYGATEASKSMVWNALGAEASRRGFTVSVYSLENPATVDKSRLKRLNPDPENFRLTGQLLNLSDPAQVLAMRERERGRDLVILDTYSHAFQPRTDTGDGNAKAIEFARVVRWLMAQTGASFVVLDHTGFERPEEPRDASAKRQQVDVAIGMERTRAWQRGRPAHFSMTNYKSARFANPFSYRGQIVGNDDEPLELVWEGAEEMAWADE